MNASVRFIYDTKKHDHISYYLKKAHFLPVKKRIEFKLCTLVFKITHNLASTYLKDLVKLHIPSRDLRVGRDLFMVESRKQSKTISNKMAEVWNKLPKHIRSANGITTFKKMLKTTYFMEEYNEQDLIVNAALRRFYDYRTYRYRYRTYHRSGIEKLQNNNDNNNTFKAHFFRSNDILGAFWGSKMVICGHGFLPF